jgi:tetratricopeptide (TPR) repeat protein
MSRSRRGLAAALTLVLAPCANAARAQPPSVDTGEVSTAPAARPRAAVPPAPDLAGLERAVGEQLAEARRALVDRLAVTDAHAPSLAAAWGGLGQLYHAYGLLDAAVPCYREAARLAPGELAWPYLLGQAERSRGDLAAARAALEEALQWGAYAPAEVALAEVALSLGDVEAAAAAAGRALALLPGDAAALAALGQARLSQRDFAGAAAAFEQALAALPAADRLHYPLALAYRGLGDHERARQQLVLVGRTGARTPDPLLAELDAARKGELAPLLRGRRAAAARDWAAAVVEFRRAVAADPTSVRARVDLGAALAMSGDPAEARRELGAALERDPGNATAHFDLGVLLLGAGEAEAALPHLEAATAAQPTDPEALRSLGEALLALGRTADALLPLRSAVAAAPGDEAARLGEAVALLRLGRLAEARERLEEAQRLMPEQGRLTHLLARLLAASPDLALRDGARAVELAARVYAAQPGADHARTLALALAEAGRCGEAASLARSLAAQVAAAEKAALLAAAADWERGPPCRPAAASPAP